MKKEMMVIRDYLWIVVLMASVGILEALVYGCSVLDCLVKVGAVMIQVIMVTGSAALQKLRILGIIGLHRVLTAWNAAKVLFTAALKSMREARACYVIPATELLELLRIDLEKAWNFRNEIVAECR